MGGPLLLDNQSSKLDKVLGSPQAEGWAYSSHTAHAWGWSPVSCPGDTLICALPDL